MRFCLIVMTPAVLVSLAGCSGGSGNSGNSGSTGSTNQNPGGGTPTPAVSISSIAPQNATAGGAGFTLTVNGSGFVSTSAISWNGVSLVTTGSSTQLTATVPAADIALVGLAQITVVNPASSGGTSGSVGFIVNGTPGFVYVANRTFGSVQTGSISAFSVDPNTGSLTPVPGSPFPAGANPSSVTADPTGKFLYEVNDKNGATTNDLFAFAINPSTGVLTAIPGSPFASAANTLSVSVDPTGKFLYTADSGGNGNYPGLPASISQFSINTATGGLTLISQVGACLPTSSDLANYVVTDPATGFLFASGPLSGLCSFSISPSGTLQPVAGSPFAVTPPGQNLLFPRSVAVDPFGKFLYTANYSATSDLSAYSITSGGALTQMSGSPFTVGPGTVASSVLADPLGRFLWVDYFSLSMDCFSIDSNTGALSRLPLSSPNSQIALNEAPNSSATPMAADPSGKFLYVLTQPGAVAQNFSITGFAIDPATAKLTPVPGSPLTLPANTTPATVTITRKAQ
jgi:6-phosphogluconolactonase